jgi:hypothetical protein
LLLSLTTCLVAATPARGVAAAHVAPAQVACAAVSAEQASMPVAFSLRWLWRPLNGVLGNQRRMLQVGTVGMCLGLWILIWRK